MGTTVYTDGACVGNPGPGGWAWAVPGARYATGFAPDTTNQRMEITAVLEAVRAIDGPIDVVSDSTYVVNCFRDRWWEGWLARDWKNAAKKPVANRDLWEPLIELYLRRRPDITFQWVKGHGDDLMNDLVDKLAVRAARLQVAEAGDGVPVVEVPSAGDDPRAPPGYRVAVVGARPPALGGYGETPTASDVRRRIGEILVAKRELQPDLVVLTGLGLGAEQLGAEAAAAAGIPYAAVLPYPDQESVWPRATQERYRALRDAASREVLIQDNAPTNRQQAGGALARRDGWLARHADEAVAVWDRRDPAVGKQVRSLQDRLGEENVWLLEP